MRYPTAWCAEIRPRPKRSTPSISPIQPENTSPRAGASLHSAGRLPRPLVSRPFALNPSAPARGVRVRVRTIAIDRDIGRIPRRRGAHRAVLPPRAVGGTARISSVGEELPEATRSPRFQPALDARSPSLIPCTQSCKRSRLKKFFSPGRACCSDCLKVRRPPPPPPTPLLSDPPR